MLDTITVVKYTGSTPGADSNTYNLFSSVTAFQGASMAQNVGLKRATFDIKHSQALTLKGYKSNDRGVTWEQVYDSGSVAAPAATDSTRLDFWFEPYPDFKVDLVNGGSAQASFSVNIALTNERSVNT
jgi:hypothetical protein